MKSKYHLLNEDIVSLFKDYTAHEIAEYLCIPLHRVKHVLRFHVKPKNMNSQIIELKEKDGLTVKQIAEFLGCGIQKVNRILRLHYSPDTYVPKYPLAEAELKHIQFVLDLHKGNKTHAARDLGISLRCLRYRTNAV